MYIIFYICASLTSPKYSNVNVQPNIKNVLDIHWGLELFNEDIICHKLVPKSEKY